MDRIVALFPVLFALIGCGVGTCLGMLYRYGPQNRVEIDGSIPLLAAGAWLGALVGLGVSGACRRWPRVIRPTSLASVLVLGAAITAPLGWIAGGLMAEVNGADEDQLRHVSRVSMALGGGTGGALGLALGLAQMRSDRRTK